jgi:hypothetical protein
VSLSNSTKRFYLCNDGNGWIGRTWSVSGHFNSFFERSQSLLVFFELHQTCTIRARIADASIGIGNLGDRLRLNHILLRRGDIAKKEDGNSLLAQSSGRR